MCARRRSTRIAVIDRGPGVPEDARQRIFEPLTRLDGTGRKGFGLGLAVARPTARAFGGDLVCRSRGDGRSGTESVFTLPRAEEPVLMDKEHAEKGGRE